MTAQILKKKLWETLFCLTKQDFSDFVPILCINPLFVDEINGWKLQDTIEGLSTDAYQVIIYQGQ